MTIIPIILISLIIAGAFAFVLSPLFEENRIVWLTSGQEPASLTMDELIARRDAIYAALKDAEFDRETGKLSDDDFQSVRARYIAEAAQILRQIDRLPSADESSLDIEIEQAVAMLRSDGEDKDISPQIAEAVEAEINSLIKHAAASPQRRLACPDCGQPYQPDDAFCAACGASLTEGVEP